MKYFFYIRNVCKMSLGNIYMYYVYVYIYTAYVYTMNF